MMTQFLVDANHDEQWELLTVDVAHRRNQCTNRPSGFWNRQPIHNTTFEGLCKMRDPIR